MLFEEDPATVEPFFIALLLFHPTWSKVWAIASVYFYARELFHMAGVTMRVAEQYVLLTFFLKFIIFMKKKKLNP